MMEGVRFKFWKNRVFKVVSKARDQSIIDIESDDLQGLHFWKSKWPDTLSLGGLCKDDAMI